MAGEPSSPPVEHFSFLGLRQEKSLSLGGCSLCSQLLTFTNTNSSQAEKVIDQLHVGYSTSLYKLVTTKAAITCLSEEDYNTLTTGLAVPIESQGNITGFKDGIIYHIGLTKA